MSISTNTGRVYKPKDCERLILYLKDINLPKPDKWGTSQLVAFLQQVITYNGFYDNNLEWVGLQVRQGLFNIYVRYPHPLLERVCSCTKFPFSWD